jgi:GT2 family glycosyltransferase
MISLILPCMRQSAREVLSDLATQTIRPDLVRIIDNDDVFIHDQPHFFPTFPFRIEYVNPGENIGTNAAWNQAWCLADHAQYVGVIGDDYRINKRCIEHMLLFLRNEVAVTCAIVKGNTVPQRTKPLVGQYVRAKGRLGFALFRGDYLKELPLIPKEFKIFFGDNWIEYWLAYMKWPLCQINTPISHEHKTDLKEKLDYPTVISSERINWKCWLRGVKEL